MKKSLFKKYFTICSTFVISGIIVLGFLLMSFLMRSFLTEKYDLLERTVKDAARNTAITYYRDWRGVASFERGKIELIYSSLATSVNGEFWLTNLDGEMLYYMENSAERAFPDSVLSQLKISPRAVATALDQGIFKETGTLGNLYINPQYVVAVPVEVGSVQLAVLFVASPTDNMRDTLLQVLKMFLVSSAVVLIVASVLIYFTTAQMVKPLKLMLAATGSFAVGDFSVHVPVTGNDEIGQLSVALNNMASKLAITESSRRSFVANVSHELRTPMTTIGGFVDGILDGTIPKEREKHYLEAVSLEVKRLSRLVRSMLDSARIEAGELVANMTYFDISEIIRQTIFTFEQAITEKHLTINGLEADKITVCADRDLLNQVVYNLIENAVKFVNEEGEISFFYRKERNMVGITIRNSGEGLENDEIPRLFDRFYKSDRSRSLNKSGVGLGLHIVRSIVSFHHGEVIVRSVPGSYTEFEILIPGGDLTGAIGNANTKQDSPPFIYGNGEK